MVRIHYLPPFFAGGKKCRAESRRAGAGGPTLPQFPKTKKRPGTFQRRGVLEKVKLFHLAREAGFLQRGEHCLVIEALGTVAGVKANTAAKGVTTFEVTGDFNDQEVFDALQKTGLIGKVE